MFFKKLLKNKTFLVISIIFIAYIVFRFLPFNKEENFTDISLNSIRNEKPQRLMYNLSNITKNQAYDIRGENMKIKKDTVSFINDSNLEDNLLNERID